MPNYLNLAPSTAGLLPRGGWLLGHPRVWVDGLTIPANLEIQRGSSLTAGVANMSDYFSRYHPVS